MKPKINKTITTKGGGNIIIPNKIIDKEYPLNKNNSKPIPSEQDVYIIKANVNRQATETSPGRIFYSYKVFFYKESASGKPFIKLQYNSGYLFKDQLNINSLKGVGAISGLGWGYESGGLSINTSSPSSTIELGGGSSSSTSNANGFAPRFLVFSFTKKEDALAIIDNFLDDVEYETNFDLD